MMTFILRRLMFIPVSLLLVSSAAFVILRVTGDPVAIYLNINSTPQQEAVLRARLHLDEPIPVQYAYFLFNVAQGDFGTSLQYGSSALPIVIQRIWRTLELVAVGLSLALVLGVLAGILCAVRKDKLTDFALSSAALVGQSMPSFWLGILLIELFALKLGWLPTSGTGSWRHIVMPAVTLSVFLMPNFILLTRTSVLETVNEHYVTTARSKGLSSRWVLFKHVLPNALNPVISFLGLQMGRLVGGSIITETIFAWPGVGRLMISAIFERDMPIVIAGVFLTSLAIILTSLLVDIAQSLNDPRIRLE